MENCLEFIRVFFCIVTISINKTERCSTLSIPFIIHNIFLLKSVSIKVLWWVIFVIVSLGSDERTANISIKFIAGCQPLECTHNIEHCSLDHHLKSFPLIRWKYNRQLKRFGCCWLWWQWYGSDWIGLYASLISCKLSIAHFWNNFNWNSLHAQKAHFIDVPPKTCEIMLPVRKWAWNVYFGRHASMHIYLCDMLCSNNDASHNECCAIW